jgi:hypothetical protein
MSNSDPDANPSVPASHPRRERSTRYPGVNLSESLKFCGSIDSLGLDGTSAATIAAGLGYKNIKTNTFSARLSSARQFGLLSLTGERYTLSQLARAILHPVDPDALSALYRQALLKPPLYAELAERLAGKRVPEATILGNVLYHNHQIIASAKQAAADAFLESAQFAGALGEDQILLPVAGPAAAIPAPSPAVTDPAAQRPSAPAPARQRRQSAGAESEVRLDLQLWDADDGKTIRIRAPRTITAASFERFLQALRLLVRIEE